MRSAILVLSVATLTCPAVALAKVTADPAFFTEATAGIVCVSGVSTSEAAPGTRLGYIDTVRGEIVMGLAADRIPAIPGLSFGVISYGLRLIDSMWGGFPLCLFWGRLFLDNQM